MMLHTLLKMIYVLNTIIIFNESLCSDRDITCHDEPINHCTFIFCIFTFIMLSLSDLFSHILTIFPLISTFNSLIKWIFIVYDDDDG